MKKILAYLKEFYNYSEDMKIIKEINRLSNQVAKLYKETDKLAKEIVKDHIEKFPKLVIQFLFMNNFTILKSRSSNAIRHIFPPNIENFNKFISFFEMLKNIFHSIDIDIELIKSEDIDDLKEDFSERYLYFYFQNYKSIINFILYWDDRLGKFPKSKINDLRNFFKEFDIYIHFNDTYINQIFGENGIINKEQLTATKFFNNIFNLSQYKRHSIYKWRDEKFFPATVVYDLNKSIYRDKIDTDFYKYIKHIKIGKAQEINKTLLDKIKNNFDDKFNKFIPVSESMLGFVIYQVPYVEEVKLNPLKEFETYLKDFPSTKLEKYNTEITKIKENLKLPGKQIMIKSIKLKDFKSYSLANIDFQNGINIFYGDNGSGKTSIIDAILFALYMDSWHTIHIIDFLNLDFSFLNTQVIRVGEEFCEVELELEKGDEIVNINRKLWRNGNQKITINNIDLFENIKKRVIQKFKDEAIKIEEYPGYYFGDLEEIPKPIPLSKIKFFIDDAINPLINRLLENDDHIFSYKLILDEYEGFSVSIEGIDDDLSEFFESVQQYFSTYFEIIDEELKLEYDNFDCLFSRSDIYSSLFQEYEFIGDFINLDFDKLHSFILDKFGVNFIDESFIYKEREQLEKNQYKNLNIFQIYFKKLLPKVEPEIFFDPYKAPDYYSKFFSQIEPMFRQFDKYYIDELDAKKFLETYSKSEELEEKIKFLEDIRDFLFNFFLNEISNNLVEISKEYFANDGFWCFLDQKGIPRIMYSKNEEILPISNLSGGERSKLLLMILSFLIKISNKSSFFIIDEPNELLDPYNINNMKSLFTRLFKNKQIIICTFIENYKSFKPALVYHVEKDLNNISFISQVSPRRGIKELHSLIEDYAREYMKPKLEEMGFTKIEMGPKRVGGYHFDIFATGKPNQENYIKKAFGEIVTGYFSVEKMDKFIEWISIIKGNEYNPDKGDIAFIVGPSQPLTQKSMQIKKNQFLFVNLKDLQTKKEFQIKEETYNLEEVPGIGHSRVKKLNQAGIHTVKDLLNCNSRLIATQIKGIGAVTINRLKNNAKSFLKVQEILLVKEK